MHILSLKHGKNASEGLCSELLKYLCIKLREVLHPEKFYQAITLPSKLDLSPIPYSGYDVYRDVQFYFQEDYYFFLSLKQETIGGSVAHTQLDFFFFNFQLCTTLWLFPL